MQTSGMSRKKFVMDAEKFHIETASVGVGVSNGVVSDPVDRFSHPGADDSLKKKQSQCNSRAGIKLPRNEPSNSISVKKEALKVKHKLTTPVNGRIIAKASNSSCLSEQGHFPLNGAVPGKFKKRTLNDASHSEGSAVMKRPYKRRLISDQGDGKGAELRTGNGTVDSAKSSTLGNSADDETARFPSAISFRTELRRSFDSEPECAPVQTVATARQVPRSGKAGRVGGVENRLNSRHILKKTLKIKTIGAAALLPSGLSPGARGLLSPRSADRLRTGDPTAESPRCASLGSTDSLSAGRSSSAGEKRLPVARRTLLVAGSAPLEEGWRRAGSPLIGLRGMRYAAGTSAESEAGCDSRAIEHAGDGHAGRIVAWLPGEGSAPPLWRLRYDNPDVGEEDLTEDE